MVLNMISNYGIGSVLFIPEHLLTFHPFVAELYLNQVRSDIGEQSVNNDANVEESNAKTTNPSAVSGGNFNRTDGGVEISNEVEALELGIRTDGRDVFVIGDKPQPAPAALNTSKTVIVIFLELNVEHLLLFRSESMQLNTFQKF